jgi:hypothetical protein
MGEDVEEKVASKISPELRKARNDGLVVTAVMILLSFFILDGGRAIVVTTLTAALYWAVFMYIVFLRGEKPIWLDLFFARFGFLLVITILACITALLSRPA